MTRRATPGAGGGAKPAAEADDVYHVDCQDEVVTAHGDPELPDPYTRPTVLRHLPDGVRWISSRPVTGAGLDPEFRWRVTWWGPAPPPSMEDDPTVVLSPITEEKLSIRTGTTARATAVDATAPTSRQLLVAHRHAMDEDGREDAPA